MSSAPNRFTVVERIAAQYPSALRNSCQDHGGSWEFLDRVVDALQAEDRRWGYNAKRGNMGDPSYDAIAYYRGGGEAEGSSDVQIFDIIGGHCGANPSAAWIDQTEATRQAGTIGRYIGRRPGRTSDPQPEPTPQPTPEPPPDVDLAPLLALLAQILETVTAVSSIANAALAEAAAARTQAESANARIKDALDQVLLTKNLIDSGFDVSLSNRFLGNISGRMTP